MIQSEEELPLPLCPATNVANPPLCAEYCPVKYPSEITNDTQRKQFKQKLLRDSPETLHGDLYKKGEVSNLIFYTDHPRAWHTALIKHYPHVKKEGICNGWKIKIRDPNDSDSIMTTVNIYKNGTAMVQGNIKEFQVAFYKLKEIAETEKYHDCENSQKKEERESDSAPSASRGVEDAEEPPTPEQDQPPPLQNSLIIIKEQFTKLEIELVQLRETVLQLQSAKEASRKRDYRQELSALTEQVTTLQRDRDSYREELDTHREQMRELQRDRDQHRRELAALTEELKDRDSTVQSLREQLYSISHQNSPTPKNQPPSNVPTSSQGITSSQPIASITPPSCRKQPLTIATTNMSTPPSRPTPPPATTRRRNQPHASAPTTTQDTPPRQSAEPTTNEHDVDVRHVTESPEQTDIVLLIDSNGKFINVKKLFPNHNATKLWCPTTQKALELLNESQLGSPSHILIHTGTNDVRAQQDGVADSLRAVIEKASNTFPQAKIVISTLLPRTDVHPLTIRDINASVSRDCALRPNVHLAHNPNMNTGCLYDHVHLHKHAVPAFAKTLKDAAFDRNPPHQSYNRGHQNTPRPIRRDSHYQPQSDRPKRSQERSEPTALPTTIRSTPAQPPQQPQLQPGMPTYAQVLSGTGSPASTELRDIQQMLGLICARLLSSGSW